MRDPIDTKLSKWPFFMGDALLLGLAYFISLQPMGGVVISLLVICVGGGAVVGILPFVLEYRLTARLAETTSLSTAVEQMRNLEEIAAQITGATGRWHNVQEASEKVSASARAIAERMATEAKAFTEFMQKANDSEKATLRLEIDKLRRMESEWLQVLVRMLDHVYALNLAAARSGQPKLMEQLGNFQIACRDAARRVGLTPFAPGPSDRFDSERHQLVEENIKPAADATVAETVATGYTFQGRLLRPALVRLNGNGNGSAPHAAKEPPRDDQRQLPLPVEPARALEGGSSVPVGVPPAVEPGILPGG
jgi:molecular chaperone GrpE (heat shock protein)